MTTTRPAKPERLSARAKRDITWALRQKPGEDVGHIFLHGVKIVYHPTAGGQGASSRSAKTSADAPEGKPLPMNSRQRRSQKRAQAYFNGMSSVNGKELEQPASCDTAKRAAAPKAAVIPQPKAPKAAKTTQPTTAAEVSRAATQSSLGGSHSSTAALSNTPMDLSETDGNARRDRTRLLVAPSMTLSPDAVDPDTFGETRDQRSGVSM